MATFKKALLFILLILSVVVLGVEVTSKLATSFFQVNQKAGIRVSSTPNGAVVYLDEAMVGKTPYEDQALVAKDYQLKIIDEQSSASGMLWQGRVKLIAGTLTVANRDLGTDTPSSAGEVLSLSKGKGVTIISSPNGSTVEIDGKEIGVTPISVDVRAGDHNFVIKHNNYLNRSIRAQVPENFSLTLNVDLSLSEADLTKISTPAISETPMVVVKDTPTGFLRVREKPNTTSREIARVSPGDELILLEEVPNWDRVRLVNGTEGFVSKTYVEKKLLDK